MQRFGFKVWRCMDQGLGLASFGFVGFLSRGSYGLVGFTGSRALGYGAGLGRYFCLFWAS